MNQKTTLKLSDHPLLVQALVAEVMDALTLPDDTATIDDGEFTEQALDRMAQAIKNMLEQVGIIPEEYQEFFGGDDMEGELPTENSEDTPEGEEWLDVNEDDEGVELEPGELKIEEEFVGVNADDDFNNVVDMGEDDGTGSND